MRFATSDRAAGPRRRAARRLARALAAAAVACTAAAARPAWSQVQAGLELDVADAYLWRGLVRSEGRVAQLGAHGGMRFGAARLSAGAWTSLQWGRGGIAGFNDLGAGERGVSELNWWAEVALATDAADARIGLVRYDYRGSGASARRTGADDTHEIFVRLAAPRLPLTPSGVLWMDGDRADGAFLETSLTASLPLLPLYGNLDLIGTLGASLGQERNPANAAESFVAERRGVTYVDLAAAAQLGAGAWAFRGALHYQLNRDGVTRRVAPARTSGHTVRLEVGVGIRIGRAG